MTHDTHDKSFVSLERKVCIVCAAEFDTNAVLIHKRLSNVLPKYSVTGMGLCPEHLDLAERGYVALVGVDPARSRPDANGQLKSEDAYRTGTIMHMTAEAYEAAFGREPQQPMAFCEEEAIQTVRRWFVEMTGSEPASSPGDSPDTLKPNNTDETPEG